MGICGSKQIKKDHDSERSEEASFESSYSIESKLGSGGFGEVFLVKNQADHQIHVAKKIPLKQHADVHTEVKLMMDLHHPHIIQLIDFYTLSKHLYIILEYMPGSVDLYDYIDLRGLLSETRSRTIFSQLLKALHYLHALHIAHLDVKPENIILRPDTGLIKLIDFGAATSLNAPTKFRGTRQYASPEILFTKTINPIAADMWASGVTLYKMLMGHLPFQSNKDYYTPLRFTRPDLSKDCVKIISSVLHPIAIQRPGSIGDVMSCPWLK